MPHIRRLRDGRAEVKFPFDRDVVEALKLRVPSAFREWSPAAKVWLVDDPWVPDVADLLRAAFGTVRVEHAPAGPGPEPAPIRRGDPDFAALHLLPSAPPSLVEAAFRALALAAHPDRQPTSERERATEQMAELNQAIERLRARRSA